MKIKEDSMVGGKLIGELEAILKRGLNEDTLQWFNDVTAKVISEKSAANLYLTYTLIKQKFGEEKLDLPLDSPLNIFLTERNATLTEAGRILLLNKIILEDEDFFSDKVAKIIEVADRKELESFLKFLILLPNPEAYKKTAVESLRTNISDVFDAISLRNPYPALYFDDQQWNQMYLKAAFMQRPLNLIEDIDKRANKDLARIISDYAHERWAASRNIDPEFWRPVAGFLDEKLLGDIHRLAKSEDVKENKAAALCSHYSENEAAKEILNNNQELKDQILSGELTWENLKS